MTWPVPSPVALPGLNRAALSPCPTSLKSRPAKPTNRPSDASSHDMAAPRHCASSYRLARPTTNWPTLNPCGQNNSAALSPTPAPELAS